MVYAPKVFPDPKAPAFAVAIHQHVVFFTLPPIFSQFIVCAVAFIIPKFACFTCIHSFTPNFTFERSARSVVFQSKIYTRPLNYTLDLIA